MNRREFFKTVGIGSATLASLPALADALTLAEPGRSSHQSRELPANPFTILLHGPYKRVGHCPNLGLLLVDPCQGSYSTTKIFAVSGIPDEERGRNNHGGHGDDDGEFGDPIGNFYVALGSDLPIAYDLPGGALTMVFTGSNVQFVPDQHGGTFIVGTFDLDITEATGIYRSFLGGHNKMVDLLHRLADGTFVEHCYCTISHA